MCQVGIIRSPNTFCGTGSVAELAFGVAVTFTPEHERTESLERSGDQVDARREQWRAAQANSRYYRGGYRLLRRAGGRFGAMHKFEMAQCSEMNNLNGALYLFFFASCGSELNPALQRFLQATNAPHRELPCVLSRAVKEA